MIQRIARYQIVALLPVRHFRVYLRQPLVIEEVR